VTDPDVTTTTADQDRAPATGAAPRAPLPQRQEATHKPAEEQVVLQEAPGISVTDLDAFYGAQHAIKGVSIEYAPNRVTAMIGPSGSGKSTVVRCLNRMHEEIPGAYATGKVMLDTDDIYGASADVVAVRRAVGMVFQKPNPFPTMSIFDNVAAGLKLNGVRGVDLKERVEQ
jgi:phosphate transport system ATP-binding protein